METLVVKELVTRLERIKEDVEESKKNFEEGRYYTFEDILEVHKKLGK